MFYLLWIKFFVFFFQSRNCKVPFCKPSSGQMIFFCSGDQHVELFTHRVQMGSWLDQFYRGISHKWSVCLLFYGDFIVSLFVKWFCFVHCLCLRLFCKYILVEFCVLCRFLCIFLLSFVLLKKKKSILLLFYCMYFEGPSLQISLCYKYVASAECYILVPIQLNIT